MPFKSQAQRAKMLLLVKQGKLKQSVFDAFDNDTGDTELPERVNPKKERPKTVEDLKKHFKEKYGR